MKRVCRDIAIQNDLSFRRIEILLCDVNENVAYVRGCVRTCVACVRVSPLPGTHYDAVRIRRDTRIGYAVLSELSRNYLQLASCRCRSRRVKIRRVRVRNESARNRREGSTWRARIGARNCVIITKTLLLENASSAFLMGAVLS